VQRDRGDGGSTEAGLVTAGRRRYPAWAAPATLVLTSLGLLDAAYLSFEHLTGSTSLACSETGTIDCLSVTTSRWSELFGIPVAYLGLGFFAVMVVACLPWFWLHGPRVIAGLRIAAAAGGLIMVFYLLWAEFFKIGAICLWCTGVHVLTFATLIALVFAQILSEPVDADPGDAAPEDDTSD